jgi:hypothetical protein
MARYATRATSFLCETLCIIAPISARVKKGVTMRLICFTALMFLLQNLLFAQELQNTSYTTSTGEKVLRETPLNCRRLEEMGCTRRFC